MCTRWPFVLLLLLPLFGSAATHLHLGANDPLTEGWLREPTDTGTSGTAVHTDDRFPELAAWQIAEPPGRRLRYEVPGPSSTEDWTLSARLRFMPVDSPTSFNSLLEVADEANRFLIGFGSNAQGDTLLDVAEAGGDVIVVPTSTPGATEYLDVMLTYWSSPGVVDVQVNGITVLENYAGFAGALTRVNFGDGQSSSAPDVATRFASVAFLSGPDADHDGLPDELEAAIGSNPNLADTDGDGLTDFQEVNVDGDPRSFQAGVDASPLVPDTDGDGVTDRDELGGDTLRGPADSNPAVADTFAGNEPPSTFSLLAPIVTPTAGTVPKVGRAGAIFRWTIASDPIESACPPDATCNEGVTYTFVIRAEATGQEAFRQNGLVGTAFVPAAALVDDTSYSWSVEAVDGFGRRTTASNVAEGRFVFDTGGFLNFGFADIRLTYTVSPQDPQQGDTVRFDAQLLSDPGTQFFVNPANDVGLTIQTPAGFTLRSVSVPEGSCDVDAAADLIDCQFDTIASAETRVVSVAMVAHASGGQATTAVAQYAFDDALGNNVVARALPVAGSGPPGTNGSGGALDLDGDGQLRPLTDGLLLLRALFQFRGQALTDGSVAEGASRNTSQAIVDHFCASVSPATFSSFSSLCD